MSGDCVAWVYGGLNPVIEDNLLVAIEVLDPQGRARLRLPLDDVLTAIDCDAPGQGDIPDMRYAGMGEWIIVKTHDPYFDVTTTAR